MQGVHQPTSAFAHGHPMVTVTRTNIAHSLGWSADLAVRGGQTSVTGWNRPI